MIFWTWFGRRWTRWSRTKNRKYAVGMIGYQISQGF